MDILDYRTLNLNRINFSDPVKVKGNCLLTKATYNYNNSQIPIYIQTPKMTAINGIVMNDTRSYIELEINKNHINFYDFINKLDEHNIHITYTNSEEWFEQKLPMDVIDDFYNSAIKMTKMNTYPTIKFKIPLYKNKKGCDIFSENGIPIDPKNVKKNTDVIGILELTGIKYFKHRFECEWNVVQLKAFTNENNTRECLIDETLLSDNEEEENVYSIEEKKNKGKINEENDTFTETSFSNPNVVEESNNIEETVNLEDNVENNEQLENKEESVNNVENVENVESINLSENENNVESVENVVESVENENNVESVENVEVNNNVEESVEESVESVNLSENENNVVSVENVEENNNIEVNNNIETTNLELEDSDIELEETELEGSDIELEESDLDESDIELEELKDLDNLEEVELNDTNEPQNMEELMEEINLLKKKALEKDEEVMSLKNKYKNLYQELNL